MDGASEYIFAINARTVHILWPYEDGAQFLADGNAVVLTATFEGVVEGDDLAVTYQYYRYDLGISDYEEMVGYPVDPGEYMVMATVGNGNYFVQTGSDYGYDYLTYTIYTEYEPG